MFIYLGVFPLLMGDSIDIVVVEEFLKRERQKRECPAQIPLELPLPLPYWPVDSEEPKEDKEDGSQRGVTIIKIYDDDDDDEKEDDDKNSITY